MWSFLCLVLPLSCTPEPEVPDPVVEVEPEPEPPPPPTVAMAVVEPSWTRDADLDRALRKEAWSEVMARTSSSGSPAEITVVAWAMMENNVGRNALDLLPTARAELPTEWGDYLAGRMYEDADQLDLALEALQVPDEGHPLRRDVLAWRATVLEDLGRQDEAMSLYLQLTADPDPLPGNAHALAAIGDDASQWRIWMHYPKSAQDQGPPGEPTWREAAHRANAWMRKGAYLTALKELQDYEPVGYDEDACLFHYVEGRSLYKKNKRTEAVAAFGDAATQCAGTEVGAKIAYLHARTEDKRGNDRTAARIFEQMAADYPDHTFADDGLVLGGIALSQAGDEAGARRLWEQARTDFPDGDLTPEGLWRLAWSHYRAGDPVQARTIALELGAMEPSRDRFHVPAGRYWAARWAMYPDVNAPTVADVTGQNAAVTEWAALCESAPWSIYAAMAHGRLREVDPARAAAIALPSAPSIEGDWEIKRELGEDPLLADAQTLLALGLNNEADKAWDAVSEHADAQAVAWWTQSRSANGDWISAHREMRVWLRDNLPNEPTPDAMRMMNVAYPDHWLTEIQAHAAPYRYDPRYFHSIVRTESNFDQDAVSWAGARGLSQVMPATGRGVGNWMGMSVSKQDLLDPEINLKVGTRYMQALHERFNDSPYLSAAGYNAGETRVDKWITEWGNPPTDEAIERIPYDETRGYVKRVVGTWQTYLWLKGEGAFPDLSKYNHKALAP